VGGAADAVKQVVKQIVVPMIAGVARSADDRIDKISGFVKETAEAFDKNSEELAKLANNGQALAMVLVRILGLRGLTTYDEIVELYNTFVPLNTNEATQAFLRGDDLDTVRKLEEDNARRDDGGGNADRQANQAVDVRSGEADVPDVRSDSAEGEQDAGEQEGP
jgi:hypothetical protein